MQRPFKVQMKCFFIAEIERAAKIRKIAVYHAPSAARKGEGGGMSSCNTKLGIMTRTKQDKPTRTSDKSRECHAAVDNFARASEA